MTKINPKSNNKAIKKTARKDIEAILNAELKTVITKFGIESKKVTKIINAGAKKLAKKFAKEIKFVKAEVTEPAASVAVTPDAVPAATVTKKTVAKKTKAPAPAKA